ncbi:hypothetical protein FACS189413_03180 [Bacteroidia bacterium]|nr:hypothetical protein FACS189413_03180 [Bacteroidia bacterium]
MKFQKIHTFAPTLNLFLIIIGYTIVTTLFLPLSGGGDLNITRLVTVPYRVFTFFISLWTLWMNFSVNRKINIGIKILLCFWVVYILKLLLLLLFNSSVAAVYDNKNEYLIRTVGSVFIPLLSVLYSYEKINWIKLFRYLYVYGLLILGIALFFNQNIMQDEGLGLGVLRLSVNIAFGSISYGQLAAWVGIFSLYLLLYTPLIRRKKIYIFLCLLFAFYSLTIAGSRGPFVSFCFVAALMIYAKQKQGFIGLIVTILIGIVFFLFQDIFYSLLENISPVISSRLGEANSDDRIGLYREAWRQFINNPIIGKDFVLLSNGYYPHNIVLESFIALGFLGGIIMIILLLKATSNAIILLQNRHEQGFIAVLLMCNIGFFMFSSALWQASTLCCLLVCVLSYKAKNK